VNNNELDTLHKAFEELHAVRNGEAWSETLEQHLDSLSYSIALGTGLSGRCVCLDRGEDGCRIEVSCGDMSEAINGPYLVTWKIADRIYDDLPKRENDDRDEEDYQQPGESDLSFARRSFDWFERMYDREDQVAVVQLVGFKYQDRSAWFWMYSYPQSGGYYTQVFPKAWPSAESAEAGLREIGFTDLDDLTEEDMPRLGFPR
jgi:hypothetical protein